ncbi:MAG: ubiquinol-cytochrome c reductase iron-sulfur subunit [Acidimicrobiia bacterium]
MSNAAIIGLAAAALVVLAVVVVVATSRRGDARAATGYLSRETRQRDKASAAAAATADTAPTGKEVELAAAAARVGTDVAVRAPSAPAPYVPMDAEQIGVTRRQFLNRANGIMMGLAVSGFGAACLAFLWPVLRGGFGAKINIGRIVDVQSAIRDGQGFYYVPEGRAWVTAYPKEGLSKAKEIYEPSIVTGMEQAGVVALYQKCVHLGCRVPECKTSQWFECQCHGSQYNRVGEKKGGPAPRGLDHFPVSVSNGTIVIDTGTIVQGVPIGVNTTGQEAEGPHCVGGGEHH